LIDHVADNPVPLRRAHKFGLAASFRIAMSSAWLATIRFSRAFADSSSFFRLA
jgi:outer membrane receptor for Fe3+-dicitrate